MTNTQSDTKINWSDDELDYLMDLVLSAHWNHATPCQKLVLLYLVTFSNKNMENQASIETISDRCVMGRNRATKALEHLKFNGLISAQNNGHIINLEHLKELSK